MKITYRLEHSKAQEGVYFFLADGLSFSLANALQAIVNKAIDKQKVEFDASRQGLLERAEHLEKSAKQLREAASRLPL